MTNYKNSPPESPYHWHLQEEDCQRLSATVSGQLTELRELREQVKALRTTELELQQFVEMFEQAATDPRDAIEAKKAERRARVQVRFSSNRPWAIVT